MYQEVHVTQNSHGINGKTRQSQIIHIWSWDYFQVTNCQDFQNISNQIKGNSLYFLFRLNSNFHVFVTAKMQWILLNCTNRIQGKTDMDVPYKKATQVTIMEICLMKIMPANKEEKIRHKWRTTYWIRIISICVHEVITE